MVDMSQKKVEIFNETLETSVEDVSMFEPMEEITTEGAEAIKMEIQEGWILFPTDNCPLYRDFGNIFCSSKFCKDQILKISEILTQNRNYDFRKSLKKFD